MGRTRSNKYVIIAAGSSITSEVWFADAADPDAEFTVDPAAPRRRRVLRGARRRRRPDRFLILHNDGAVNFTLVDAPVDDPTAQRTLIAARDDVRLDGADAFADHLVVSYRREALPRIQLWPITTDGLRHSRGDHLRLRADLGRPGGQPELVLAQAAGRNHVVHHPAAGL